MTYRYIYKITCTSGSFKDKFYFGQHTTDNLDDEYKGSDRKLRDYYKKYPNDYIKEIISYHDTLEELNQAEYDIIHPYLNDNNCLNLKDGGNQGTLSEETKNKISISNKGKIISEETKKKMSIAHDNYSSEIKEKQRKVSSRNITKYNKSEEHRIATIESNKRRWENGVPEETLKHFREAQAKYWANKGKVVWVHKYEQTKMIPIGEYQKYISDGWKKGRNDRNRLF